MFNVRSGRECLSVPQVHGLVASYAALVPAKKEADRIIAAAAAAAGGAGEAKRAAAASGAAQAAAAAAGPSAGLSAATAGGADGDSDDDCAVVDAKTSDELYEVRRGVGFRQDNELRAWQGHQPCGLRA